VPKQNKAAQSGGFSSFVIFDQKLMPRLAILQKISNLALNPTLYSRYLLFYPPCMKPAVKHQKVWDCHGTAESV
jgi:hypothetical protein